MAHFIPSEFDDKNHPKSERNFFEALKNNLSNDWIVFHSFEYLVRDESGRLKDGEIDFLLYHERKGFLVIEVKGGTISLINGQWYQDDHPIDPFDQARKNKYAVITLIKEGVGHAVALQFADAVCFPSCSRDDSITWPPEAKDIVIFKDDFKDIEQIAYRMIDDTYVPRDISGSISVEQVLDIFSPEFGLVQRLRERIADDETRFFQLTERKNIILDSLKNFPRLLFEGGAGTGKTILAINKAKMVAKEGGRALILCYNELLAKRIGKAVMSYPRVFFGAFFEFCVELMGIPQEEYERYKGEPRLYSEILPNLLHKYLSQNNIKYDAVIVDEAQDFTPEMWNVIPELIGQGGLFYVFYDPSQNIFRDKLTLPDFGLPPIVLSQNCRNTRKIFEAMSPYCSTEMSLPEKCPSGSDVIDRKGDTRQILAEELHRLYQVERLMQSDVVVLGAHSLKNTSLGDDTQCGDYRLVEQPKGIASKDVTYYTYMKFKGCEAKAVILIDVDENDPRWNANGLYTAMSRAIHHLVVIRKA